MGSLPSPAAQSAPVPAIIALSCAVALAGCSAPKAPAHRMECVVVATGERFTYRTDTVERLGYGIGAIVDENGWQRPYTRETLPRWRCRRLATTDSSTGAQSQSDGASS